MRRLLVAALLLLTAGPAAAQHVSPTTTLPSGVTLNNPNITGTVTGGATYTSPTLTTPTINGAASSSTVTLGSGSGAGRLGGVFDLQTSGAACTNASTDDTLFTKDIPANTLSATGREVVVESFGTTAANTNTKTFKVWVGGTAQYTLATAVNGTTWKAEARLVRTGANAQTLVVYIHAGDSSGFPKGANAASTFKSTTTSLTDTAAITVKVTAACGTASDATGTYWRMTVNN